MKDAAPIDVAIVAEGLRFPEGPVWMKDGSVIVTEIGAGAITRVWPDGRKERIAACGGGPNGAAIGPDGWLYVCNNGGMICHEENGLTTNTGAPPEHYQGGWIDRIDPDTGTIQRLYEAVDGRRLAGPNDIVFAADGSMWFSDLGRDIGPVTHTGGIFHATADGSAIRRVVDGLRVNGIGLSPDGDTLYGALTYESLLLRFPVTAPGALSTGDGFLPGEVVTQFAARQWPDSLALTADGDICVATCLNHHGVSMVDAATGTITRFAFPDELTTNICFGGADMRDAWVTQSTSGRLLRLRWPKPGLRLTFYA